MALFFVKYSEVSLINYRFLFLGNYIQLNIENVDLNKALIHLIYFFSFFFIWCKLIFNTFSSAFTSVKLTAAWTVFLHFYIFWYSVLLWHRIRKEKVKKKNTRDRRRGMKRKEKTVCVCYFISLWPRIYHLSRTLWRFFPQCRLRTLHPCSTEAAWERPRSESVLRLKEEKENFSLSQTPTQMLTISIT